MTRVADTEGDDDAASPAPGLEILLVGMHYEPETTGNAPYTAGLARALNGAGHRVRVVTGFPHYPGWCVFPGYRGLRIRENDSGVSVVRVRHPVPRKPTALRRVLMDVVFTLHAMTVRGPRPDVVITVSPVLLAVLAGLRRRKPGRTTLGVVIQDLYSRALVETQMASGRIARLAAALERALLSRADGVAVVHENFVSNLEQLGIGNVPVTVIQNWAHVPESTADRDATRARLGWADDVIVLHAGNMGLKQGLENVVEAARIADTRGSRVRFVLLGDGAQRVGLEQAGRSVERLQFLRPLPGDAFVDALAAADLLLLNEAPSVAEMSVPSKLTSYFTSGRAVVAVTHAHSAAAAEIANSGGGVRADPGDPGALHDVVLALAADPARCAEMGGRGRLYAKEELAASTAAQKYLSWVTALSPVVLK